MEPTKVAVLDQVIRMLVMAGIADVRAQVVHQRRILEPLALAISQAMNRTGLLEERQGQTDDLARVIGVVVATFGQFQRAAPPYVWNAIDLGDLSSVASDVIENEPFAQREIAQRQLFRP